MYRIYDTMCKDCNNVEEVFVDLKEKSMTRKCSVCGGELKRIYTSFNFKLEYTASKDMCGWADSGYATSQYWRYVKEAEERTGKRHKGVYDD